jgi:hypothetical protein
LLQLTIADLSKMLIKPLLLTYGKKIQQVPAMRRYMGLWMWRSYAIAMKGLRIVSRQWRSEAAMSNRSAICGGGLSTAVMMRGLIAHSPWKCLSKHASKFPTTHCAQTQVVQRAFNCVGNASRYC